MLSSGCFSWLQCRTEWQCAFAACWLSALQCYMQLRVLQHAVKYSGLLHKAYACYACITKCHVKQCIESLYFVLLQVWSGALTWCPRCGPPGGTSSAQRGRSSRKPPRVRTGETLALRQAVGCGSSCAWYPASMTLLRQTSRTGDVVRPTTAEGRRRAAAHLLPAWRQLLPSLSSRRIACCMYIISNIPLRCRFCHVRACIQASTKKSCFDLTRRSTLHVAFTGSPVALTGRWNG